MPRKSLHGRTCGVSREGGRARASQPNRSPPLYCRPGRAHRHPKDTTEQRHKDSQDSKSQHRLVDAAKRMAEGRPLHRTR
ncbi:hypothetical protein DYQ94_17050 [Xanthomonas sp. LMG 8993]|nr:hypothetical protein [Xanthomonas sp. LMG 8993]